LRQAQPSPSGAAAVQRTGRQVATNEIRCWLNEKGFTCNSGNWYGDDGAVRHLLPDEFMETVSVENIDGANFVKRQPPPGH